MMIKQPTSLLEVLELQKILDSNINSARERDLDDIKLSMIAEIIEFNEECECSHKTWKSKQVDVDKMKEEAIDVLFFFAQMLNYFRNDKQIIKEVVECFNLHDSKITDYLKTETMWLIKCVIENRMFWKLEDWTRIMESLNIIYKTLGMTEEEVYKIYFDKWQKNMKRIGGEWN